MINIYRSGNYDPEINVFHGRGYVTKNEVVLKTKNVFGRNYEYAEPLKPGCYAFGGSFLFTSNGVFPEFNHPIKLHDRDMSKETTGMGD